MRDKLSGFTPIAKLLYNAFKNNNKKDIYSISFDMLNKYFYGNKKIIQEKEFINFINEPLDNEEDDDVDDENNEDNDEDNNSINNENAIDIDSDDDNDENNSIKKKIKEEKIIKKKNQPYKYINGCLFINLDGLHIYLTYASHHSIINKNKSANRKCTKFNAKVFSGYLEGLIKIGELQLELNKNENKIWGYNDSDFDIIKT